jgi:ribosomal protein L33
MVCAAQDIIDLDHLATRSAIARGQATCVYIYTPYVCSVALYTFTLHSKECGRRLSCHKFNRICRKYIQHLYLEINLMKN